MLKLFHSFFLWLFYFHILALGLTVSFHPAAAERLSIPSHQRLLIIASRPTAEEAWAFARPYQQTFTQVQVFRASNDWYPISLGVVDRVQGEALKDELIAAGEIPDDSYLSTTARFVAVVPDPALNTLPGTLPNNRLQSSTESRSDPAPARFQILEPGRYGHQNIGAAEQYFWQVSVPAGRFGVFTLVNESRVSDVDLWIYADPGMRQLLRKGTQEGAKTELLQFYNDARQPRDVYIRVRNYGQQPTTYRLHSHSISISEQIGEGLAEASLKFMMDGLMMWALGVEADDTDEDELSPQDVSRANTLLLNALANRDLGQTSVDLVINEISLELEKAFGMGFLFDFLLSTSRNIVEEIYLYYE